MDGYGRRGARRAVTGVAAAAALLAASGVAVATPAGMPVASHARLVLRASAYGTALFASNGRTAYVFSADRAGKSACYGACATAWPPLLTRGAPTAVAGVEARLLGTTRRRDGSLQVTYRGRPLYT